MAFVTFNNMFAPEGKTKRRLWAALSVVFVFSLTLHFHSSLTSQVTKECSCIHGTRTQLAFHADTPTVAPLIQFTALVSPYVFSWSAEWPTIENVRGPPTALAI